MLGVFASSVLQVTFSVWKVAFHLHNDQTVNFIAGTGPRTRAMQAGPSAVTPFPKSHVPFLSPSPQSVYLNPSPSPFHPLAGQVGITQPSPDELPGDPC